jgi:hypothetical protein
MKGKVDALLTREVAWQNLLNVYVSWKMARDEDFWKTLNYWVDPPLPEEPYNPYQ